MAMPKNFTNADFPVGTSNPDPVEIMAANFEDTIERLHEALSCICLNASIQPDRAMGGATDCYAVPLDDIQNGRAVLKYTQRREPNK